MKPEKLWSVIEHYKSALCSLGIVAKQMTSEQYDSRVAGQDVKVMLPHCAWMLQHCLDKFRPEYENVRLQTIGSANFDHILRMFDPLGKAMRWMAYVQGVLNSFGVYSCNHLRDHSRAAQKE